MVGYVWNNPHATEFISFQCSRFTNFRIPAVPMGLRPVLMHPNEMVPKYIGDNSMRLGLTKATTSPFCSPCLFK